jgi:hypothetical protein
MGHSIELVLCIIQRSDIVSEQAGVENDFAGEPIRFQLGNGSILRLMAAVAGPGIHDE